MLPCRDIFAVSDNVLLHMWFQLRRARHNRAAQLVSLEITEGTYDLGIWYSLSSQALSVITCEQVAQHCYVALAETLRPV